MNLANLATLAAIVDRGSRRAAEAEADDGDARQSLLRGESTRTYNASGNVISTTNSPSATSRSMPWTTSCPSKALRTLRRLTVAKRTPAKGTGTAERAPRREVIRTTVESRRIPGHSFDSALSQMRDHGEFTTARLASRPSELAPDGSIVRPLLGLAGATMAHFALATGGASRAVAHRTVEELWFVLAGRGELWRKQGSREEIVVLEPGVCASLPRGTHFQFRASATQAVEIVAVTVPRWPGDEEAEFVDGPWPASAALSGGARHK